MWIVAVAILLIARFFPLLRTLTQGLQPEEQKEMLFLLVCLCTGFLFVGMVIRAARK